MTEENGITGGIPKATDPEASKAFDSFCENIEAIRKEVYEKRTSRHVVPRNKGKQWAVTKPGAVRASGVYDSKRMAVSRAQMIVMNLGGGYVYVHNKNGRIEYRCPPGRM